MEKFTTDTFVLNLSFFFFPLKMSSLFLDRIEALAEISKKKLTKILDKIPGRKNLVIEPSLMKPLDRFIGASTLR